MDPLLRQTIWRHLIKISRTTPTTIDIELPIYAALAKAPKYQRLALLQDRVDVVSQLLGVASLKTVVTPSLLQKVLIQQK